MEPSHTSLLDEDKQIVQKDGIVNLSQRIFMELNELLVQNEIIPGGVVRKASDNRCKASRKRGNWKLEKRKRRIKDSMVQL